GEHLGAVPPGRHEGSGAVGNPGRCTTPAEASGLSPAFLESRAKRSRPLNGEFVTPRKPRAVVRNHGFDDFGSRLLALVVGPVCLLTGGNCRKIDDWTAAGRVPKNQQNPNCHHRRVPRSKFGHSLLRAAERGNYRDPPASVGPSLCSLAVQP